MLHRIRGGLARARIAFCLLGTAAWVAATGACGQVADPTKVLPKDKTLPAPLGAIVSMTHDVKPFGKTKDGQEVTVHTLTNLKGMRVKLISYGATLISVETPDRDGKNANVTLSFPNLDGYLQRHPYFGSTVGRYAQSDRRTASSRWTARRTRWRRTTGRIICTAA